MIIVHRCLTCSHPGFAHQTGMCSSGFCPCPSYAQGASEPMPTYRMGRREEVTDVVEPGAYWNSSSTGPAGSSTRMCGCEECREVYNQITGAGVGMGDGPSW